MKTDQHIRDLYERYLSNQIDEIALQELFDCFDNEDDKQRLMRLISHTMASEPREEQDEKMAELVHHVKHQLRQKLQPDQKRKNSWSIYAAAAITLLAIGASLFLFKERNSPMITITPKEAIADIQPGSNKAILTLSDGKKIELSDKDLSVYAQSGVEIKQQKDGSIIYQLSNTSGASTTDMNSIEVPKGGQYKIILPDGTKVWLNSASTLRYPAAFGSVSRTMEMTGEAFFAIAPNKNFPFKVVASGQEVTALGTSFNINAYANEPAITTTLLEGKLKVEDKKANNMVIIHPGQQTRSRGGKLTVDNVNAADVMAWKDGLFVNNNASLEAVMRQIERWYDVTVDVKLPAGAGTFSGELPKNTPLTELLQSLEVATGIKLKLEGRRVTNR
ncbi:MAG: FecR domain-containing protein [Sphingobacterium sp.]|nr:FecR domain-containing protein [Sphingobacterium sp.]